MILGFTPFEFVCNIIFYLEFCVFLHSVLTPRFSKGWMYLSYACLVVYVLLICTVFAKMSILRVLTLPVTLMFYNLIFYRDKRLRCIFAAWFILVIMFLSEVIVVALVYSQEMLEASLHEAPLRVQILCWGIEMVSAGVMYWITALVLNRVRNRFSVREMLMYTFFPVSQCLLLYGWVNAARQLGQSETQQFLVLAVTLICLAADAGLFLSMIHLSHQIELETENRLLAAQIEAQREHYAELTAQFEGIRKMRHDIPSISPPWIAFLPPDEARTRRSMWRSFARIFIAVPLASVSTRWWMRFFIPRPSPLRRAGLCWMFPFPCRRMFPLHPRILFALTET